MTVMGSNELENLNSNTEISAVTDALLLDVRSDDIPRGNSYIVPIAQLNALGSGVASLIPRFNTVTKSTTVSNDGLYRIVNLGKNDALKQAKNGNFWGAFKTPEGKSVFAQLQSADGIKATDQLVMKANPATMMMAVTLASVEKELDDIKEMEKQIISFLQVEKEAEIEADVITLTDIVSKFKHNWDNDRFIGSNHKMVCDIQRTARKNMISYQKIVAEALKSKTFLASGGKIDSTLSDMLKKFKYYRLSLYTFSLSFLAEIMLSGNYKAENINAALEEVNKNTDEYRELFGKCSLYLEKMSDGAIKTNILKGVGIASNAMGKLAGNIPKVKDSKLDTILIEKGDKIQNGAQEISREVIESFAEVSNPGTAGFMRKLEDLDCIYNHVNEICFDKDYLYLVYDEAI